MARKAPNPRESMPTLTDPVELETARVLSTYSNPPPVLEVYEVEIEEAPIVEERSGQDMMRSIPAVIVSAEQLAAQPLDHRAGFVLSLIDGKLRVESILDVSGMPAQEAVAIFRELERRGLVRLVAPSHRVIAEGDDGLARGLTLEEALDLAETARASGKRYVAIVDDATGAMIDEQAVRSAKKHT